MRYAIKAMPDPGIWGQAAERISQMAAGQCAIKAINYGSIGFCHGERSLLVCEPGQHDRLAICSLPVLANNEMILTLSYIESTRTGPLRLAWGQIIARRSALA